MSEVNKLKSKTIMLPEDQPTQLFVLSMGSLSMMYHYFTPERYDNEILQQEVTGLTNLSRDLHTGHIRRLASEKRERGLIEDIGNESITKRVPSWLYYAVPLFFIVAIVAYGQYNPQFSNGATTWFNANGGYVIVTVILFMAVLLLYFGVFRRKRKQA